MIKIITFVIALFSAAAFSQVALSDADVKPPKATFSESADASFSSDDAFVNKWLKKHNIPTLGLGVINDGVLQQIKVYGKLDGKKSAPFNAIFNVASLAKPITAMVALSLVSKGQWSLDEPLSKYWVDPDIENDERSELITTRSILSHQTGLPNWRGKGEAQKLTFDFDPGTGYQYSGEGFEYLRAALEKKFSKTLDQLAQELIFAPLDMNDTEFFWSEATDSERYAENYSSDGEIYGKTDNKTANAADDLLTTIKDYGNFLLGVMNGTGLSEEVFKELTEPQIIIKSEKSFGLGVLIYDLGKGEIAVSHGGGDNGVQTLFVLLPGSKQGLIIFTNVDDGYKIYEELLEYYLGASGRKIYEIETG